VQPGSSGHHTAHSPVSGSGSRTTRHFIVVCFSFLLLLRFWVTSRPPQPRFTVDVFSTFPRQEQAPSTCPRKYSHTPCSCKAASPHKAPQYPRGLYGSKKGPRIAGRPFPSAGSHRARRWPAQAQWRNFVLSGTRTQRSWRRCRDRGRVWIR
jgi:hypothetical protein